MCFVVRLDGIHEPAAQFAQAFRTLIARMRANRSQPFKRHRRIDMPHHESKEVDVASNERLNITDRVSPLREQDRSRLGKSLGDRSVITVAEGLEQMP